MTLLLQFANCIVQKFIGIGATSDFRLGVYSRTIGGGLFANFNAAFFEAKQLTFSNKLAVIGRRKTGHGD